MESEDSVRLRLEELHKDLGKKQKFEESVSTIVSLLRDRYPTASPSLRKSVRPFSPLLFNLFSILVHSNFLDPFVGSGTISCEIVSFCYFSFEICKMGEILLVLVSSRVI